jgi:hypothetical protein
MMRSAARRAFSATTGSTRTSSFICNRLSKIFRQRDALHVRAGVARPGEFHVRQFGLHIVRHGAFGDQHDGRGESMKSADALGSVSLRSSYMFNLSIYDEKQAGTRPVTQFCYPHFE